MWIILKICCKISATTVVNLAVEIANQLREKQLEEMQPVDPIE